MDMTCPNCGMTAICDNEVIKGKCKYCGARIIFDTRKDRYDRPSSSSSAGLEGQMEEAMKLLKLAKRLIDGRDKGEIISNGVEYDIGTFNIEYDKLLKRKAA